MKDLIPGSFHRFQVLLVEKQAKCLLLKLQHVSSSELYECQISGTWLQSVILPGNIVNIKSEKFSGRTLYVDNDYGFITVDPDLLITSTLLSSSVFCLRKAWLSEKFRGMTVGNKATGNKYMLIGTLVHKIFQVACTRRARTLEMLKKIMESILTEPYIIIECLGAEITEKELSSEVEKYLPSILKWLQQYVLNNASSLEDEALKIRVVSIEDIEDNIWCPSLGVKGKVDASCDVEIHYSPLKKSSLPLELKTGRASFSNEHIGQVSLYSMMMKERNIEGCDGGLLLYLKDDPKMRLIRVKRPVERSIVQRRNELAYYLRQTLSGPETKESPYHCRKCEHLLDCCLMLKTFEQEKIENSGVFEKQLVPDTLIHLTLHEIEFFKHWIKLVDLEMEEAKSANDGSVFWSEPSFTREQLGLGLSDLIINSINEETVIFKRNPNCSPPSALKTFCDEFVGERVAISYDEKCFKVPRKVAIYIGFVVRMDDDEIEVSLDRPFKESDFKISFRIDVVQRLCTNTLNNDNLLNLMEDTNLSLRLRDLIINRQVPQSNEFLTNKLQDLAIRFTSKMNSFQQKAVLEVLKAPEYLLIQGTPGSGKTYTIVTIIRLLIALKKSVLVTSHTHAAVDNILCKLVEHDVDFVRFGEDSRIHPLIKKYSIYSFTKNLSSSLQLRQFYDKINVAGVTCMGILSDPIFSMKTFDYCIVDEASQILLPTNLGPLFCSQKFILVGDEKQLPPVVQSRIARSNGLEESLFNWLLKNGPSIQLAIQYRMNSEILAIPSQMFYNDSLKCGSDSVANAVIPAPKTLSSIKWLDEVLSDELTKSFLFLNTDKLNFSEKEDNVENELEASIAQFLVREFIERCLLTAKDIGLISPFHKQVALLKKKINHSSILINTIDQYQGKEKMIIIISFVKRKTNRDFSPSSSEILADARRLNVALTRASRKLILLGSQSTLSHYEPFQHLFKLMQADQFIEIKTINNLGLELSSGCF